MNALKTFTCNTFVTGWVAIAASAPLVNFDAIAVIGVIGFAFGVTLLAFAAIGALILGAASAVSD